MFLRLMTGESVPGRSPAAETMQFACDLAFDELGLEVVPFEVPEDKARAMALYESLGFLCLSALAGTDSA